MKKPAIPLVVKDISHFSRLLETALQQEKTPPGHLRMMNLVAKAAGFQNYQHLRASHLAGQRLEERSTPAPAPAIDHRKVTRALTLFDTAGRLTIWPGRQAVQDLCLWVMWAAIPAGQVLEERDVNGALNRVHNFDDAAILRRSLVSQGFLTRDRDGTNYQRVEQKPTAEALALFEHLAAQRGAA